MSVSVRRPLAVFFSVENSHNNADMTKSTKPFPQHICLVTSDGESKWCISRIIAQMNRGMLL